MSLAAGMGSNDDGSIHPPSIVVLVHNRSTASEATTIIPVAETNNQTTSSSSIRDGEMLELSGEQKQHEQQQRQYEQQQQQYEQQQQYPTNGTMHHDVEDELRAILPRAFSDSPMSSVASSPMSHQGTKENLRLSDKDVEEIHIHPLLLDDEDLRQQPEQQKQEQQQKQQMQEAEVDDDEEEQLPFDVDNKAKKDTRQRNTSHNAGSDAPADEEIATAATTTTIIKELQSPQSPPPIINSNKSYASESLRDRAQNFPSSQLGRVATVNNNNNKTDDYDHNDNQNNSLRRFGKVKEEEKEQTREASTAATNSPLRRSLTKTPTSTSSTLSSTRPVPPYAAHNKNNQTRGQRTTTTTTTATTTTRCTSPAVGTSSLTPNSRTRRDDEEGKENPPPITTKSATRNKAQAGGLREEDDGDDDDKARSTVLLLRSSLTTKTTRKPVGDAPFDERTQRGNDPAIKTTNNSFAATTATNIDMDPTMVSDSMQPTATNTTTNNKNFIETTVEDSYRSSSLPFEDECGPSVIVSPASKKTVAATAALTTTTAGSTRKTRVQHDDDQEDEIRQPPPLPRLGKLSTRSGADDQKKEIIHVHDADIDHGSPSRRLSTGEATARDELSPQRRSTPRLLSLQSQYQQRKQLQPYGRTTKTASSSSLSTTTSPQATSTSLGQPALLEQQDGPDDELGIATRTIRVNRVDTTTSSTGTDNFKRHVESAFPADETRRARVSSNLQDMDTNKNNNEKAHAHGLDHTTQEVIVIGEVEPFHLLPQMAKITALPLPSSTNTHNTKNRGRLPPDVDEVTALSHQPWHSGTKETPPAGMENQAATVAGTMAESRDKAPLSPTWDPFPKTTANESSGLFVGYKENSRASPHTLLPLHHMNDPQKQQQQSRPGLDSHKAPLESDGLTEFRIGGDENKDGADPTIASVAVDHAKSGRMEGWSQYLPVQQPFELRQQQQRGEKARTESAMEPEPNGENRNTVPATTDEFDMFFNLRESKEDNEDMLLSTDDINNIIDVTEYAASISVDAWNSLHTGIESALAFVGSSGFLEEDDGGPKQHETGAPQSTTDPNQSSKQEGATFQSDGVCIENDEDDVDAFDEAYEYLYEYIKDDMGEPNASLPEDRQALLSQKYQKLQQQRLKHLQELEHAEGDEAAEEAFAALRRTRQMMDSTRESSQGKNNKGIRRRRLPLGRQQGANGHRPREMRSMAAVAAVLRKGLASPRKATNFKLKKSPGNPVRLPNDAESSSNTATDKNETSTKAMVLDEKKDDSNEWGVVEREFAKGDSQRGQGGEMGVVEKVAHLPSHTNEELDPMLEAGDSAAAPIDLTNPEDFEPIQESDDEPPSLHGAVARRSVSSRNARVRSYSQATIEELELPKLGENPTSTKTEGVTNVELQKESVAEKPRKPPRLVFVESASPTTTHSPRISCDTDPIVDGKPVMVTPFHNDIGIPKGDVLISLLNDDSPDISWSRRVDEAIWRGRIMRRNCDSMWLQQLTNRYLETQIDPSKKDRMLGRSSVQVDIDDARVVGGIGGVSIAHEAAWTHLKYDEFDDALALTEDVLKNYENYFNVLISSSPTGKTSFRPYLGCALHNLGLVHMLRGEYQKAYEYLERAASNRAGSIGTKHPDYLASVVRMATCLLAQNEFQKARSTLEDALSLSPLYPSIVVQSEKNSNVEWNQSLNLAEVRQVAEILNNLGCALYMCGEVKKSMPLFIESIQLQQLAADESIYFGTRFSCHSLHLGRSVARANVGFLALVARDLETSIAYLESAAKDQHLLLRDAHETLMSTLDHLAVAQVLAGNKTKALLLLRRVLFMQQSAFGPADVRCLVTVRKLQMVQTHDSFDDDDDDDENGATEGVEGGSPAQARSPNQKLRTMKRFFRVRLPGRRLRQRPIQPPQNDKNNELEQQTTERAVKG